MVVSVLVFFKIKTMLILWGEGRRPRKKMAGAVDLKNLGV